VRKRNYTIGWGPKENAPHYVNLAQQVYAEHGSPATLVISWHAAESVSNAGFRSAMFIQQDRKLKYEYQFGELLTMVAAGLGTLARSDEDFAGFIFVNHMADAPGLPRPTRHLEEAASLIDAAEKFCRLAGESLKSGAAPFLGSPRGCDWIYLCSEAVIE
jgi:hypothetical protein